MVEWRSTWPSTARFQLGRDELMKRRDGIMQLLQRVSSMTGAKDYRILDYVGYVEAEDREDGQATEVFDFVSRYPAWADPEQSPVTMHSLLTDAFESHEPGMVPSLRTRFNLAKHLANALYQLQCCNWLHRNLSSLQVGFFRDKRTATLRLDEPHLVGFQYSHPDDNVGKSSTRNETRSEGINYNKELPDIYLHLDLTARTPRRYRRSDDVYSVGIMLFETAFWEPAHIFLSAGDTVRDAASGIVNTAEEELAAEVGEYYKDAVLCCLRGLRGDLEQALSETSDTEEEKEYDGTYGGEDPEFGLEVDFLWKVLREIEKCQV